MKRSIFLLTLGLFLIGPSIRAQVVPQVEWGEKKPSFHRIMDVIGRVDSSYFVLRGVPGVVDNTVFSAVNLQELDRHLNPVAVHPLRLFHQNDELNIEKGLRYGNDMFIFASRRNPGRRAKELFATRINRQTRQPDFEPVLVATIPVQNRFMEGDFSYKFSRDSSHFLLFTQAGTSQRDPRHLSFNVYNRELDLVWSKSVTLPYYEQQYEISDFIVDRNGNTYLLGKLYPKNRRVRWRSQQRYEYRVIAFRNKGLDREEYAITVKNRYLSDIHLEIAPNGDLICAGFYSDRNTLSARGTFYLTINSATKEVVKSSFYDFSVDFLTLNLTQGQERRQRRRVAKGRNVELYRYDIRDLIPRGDGGVVLTAEQYYMQTVSATDLNTTMPVTRILYNYNTILVVSIDPDGEIEWATKIPKSQKASLDQARFASYGLMITDEKLYFIYNDHRKNIEEQRVNRLRNFSLDDRTGIVAIASVDPLGQVERQRLLPNRELATLTRPRLCTQISPEEMLMIGRFERSTQFGRLTFEEEKAGE